MRENLNINVESICKLYDFIYRAAIYIYVTCTG